MLKFARAEIENARAAVQRVEEALQEQEQMSRASGKQVCAICVFLDRKISRGRVF